MTSMSSTLDADRANGPRRWGLAFAGIWLFFLLSPLSRAWQHRDAWRGWVGIGATLAVRGGLHVDLRVDALAAHRCTVRRSARRARWASVWSGSSRARRADVRGDRPGRHRCGGLHRGRLRDVPRDGWAWLVAVTVALGTYAATIVVPGWHKDPGILFGIMVASLAILGISQVMNRNIEVLAVREENARLAVDDERNRFARDLHDILGHSLTVITVKAELAEPPARRRPRAGPRRARRPRAAVARRARRRTPGGRGLPRPHAARRAGAGAHRPVGGRDRCRPAQLHRRRADRPARAVRLDGPRGRHQRDPALRCSPVHRPARCARGRDPRRRTGAESAGAGLRAGRSARARRRRRRHRRHPAAAPGLLAQVVVP